MSLRRYLLAALLGLSCHTTAAQTDTDLCILEVTNNLHVHSLGLFYVGHWDGDSEYRLDNIGLREPEALVQVISPGQSIATKTSAKHAFHVRSSTFDFRAQIAVWRSQENERPFVIALRNLMTESSNQPMELKAGESSYIWIEPGQENLELSDELHPATLRNKHNEPVVTFRLAHVHGEL